jgi:hypothetical protein
MAHLRTFQSGKHSALSQRLLNEVAAAKVLLLNSAKKAAYDEKLRSSLARPAPMAAEELSLARRASMGAGEAAPGPNDLSPWEDIVGSPRRAAQPSTQARRLQHKRPSNLGVIFALGLTGAAALLAIVVWLAPRHEGETVDESALAEKQSPQSNRRQASHRGIR